MTKEKETFQLTPKRLAAYGLIGAASYFLLIEHREHLYEWLPFLILASCPLMHIFMHGGHGGHGGHEEKEAPKLEELEDESYRRGLEEGKKQSGQHDHQGE